MMSRPVFLTLILCAAIFGPPLYFSQVDQPDSVGLLQTMPARRGESFAAQPTVNSVFTNAQFPAQDSPALLPTGPAVETNVGQTTANVEPNGFNPASGPTSTAFPSRSDSSLGQPWIQTPDGNIVVMPGSESFFGSPSDQRFQLPTTGSPTTVFRGTAYGPNFASGPMSFQPTVNFPGLFRFDITPTWIKSQWSRISTTPGEFGLDGYRVALVTGTGPWDLHGSLTYFFDNKQTLQRISFHGWTGDASRLLKFLQEEYQFEPHPTRLAGLHVSKRGYWKKRQQGAIILKNPSIIRAENPVQQVAMILELNHPKGKLGLSESFASKVAAAKPQSKN